MPLPAEVTRLGPYEVLARLGAGGMGEVYRARDTRLGREVALKILPPAFADDPARRARFESEAKSASGLNHPGIVTVFDVGKDNGLAYLVTELVDGETLREERPESLRQQLDIAAQIAEALAAAHSGGITHRDLKPENVMVTRDGRAKLLDFGLARQAVAKPDDPTLTQEGAMLGTVGYMSPEQARGRPADNRSDIFSLGAVLYELFGGRRAFQGESAADTLSAILKQEPADLPPEVPAGVRQIVQHCLEKEPDRRFQSARDLAFALRALSGSSVATAPPTELASAKRSRSAIWLAAAVATVVAGFAVHAWLFTPSNVDLASLRYTPVALNTHATGSLPGSSWAPDGKTFAYVGQDANGQRQIFVQSLASATPSQLTREGWAADYPLFSMDGGRVYFLGQEKAPREVWSISTGGGSPERLLPSLGGPEFLDGIAVSRDGKALVIARLEDDGKLPMSLWISSPPGSPPHKYPGSPSAAARVLGRARLRFSPNGSWLLAMLYERQYEFWLLPWPPSESGRGIRRILPEIKDWGFVSSADWMPDSQHLLLSESGLTLSPGRLWMADVESGKLSPVSAANSQYAEPAVNPIDGRILVGQVRELEDAVEIPLDGSAPRDLVATSRRELYPAWSPIADQFVYVTDRRGDEEIWLSSRKEGWHRPLVTQNDLPSGNKYRFVAPVWSPDGSRLAYGTAGAGVWISPLAGGPATPILPKGVPVGFPTWSPDGAWIAFSRLVDNKRYLSKQKVGSNTPPIVISEAAGSFRPAWSPDGKWITIQLAEGFGIISPDGQQKRIIFRGDPGFASACGWSRDGSTLYLGYLKGQDLILSGFDVRTGTERKISNLGPKRFSYLAVYSALLSEAPDKKSLASSFLNPDADIWMIEGVQPPPDFWHRLLWRPGRTQ